MTSEPSNYHRKYSPDGSHSPFQSEISDVISVLKNSIEYSFAFFKVQIKWFFIPKFERAAKIRKIAVCSRVIRV